MLCRKWKVRDFRVLVRVRWSFSTARVLSFELVLWVFNALKHFWRVLVFSSFWLNFANFSSVSR